MRNIPELVEILRRPTCTDGDCRTERYEVANALEKIIADAKDVEARSRPCSRLPSGEATDG